MGGKIRGRGGSQEFQGLPPALLSHCKPKSLSLPDLYLVGGLSISNSKTMPWRVSLSSKYSCDTNALRFPEGEPLLGWSTPARGPHDDSGRLSAEPRPRQATDAKSQSREAWHPRPPLPKLWVEQLSAWRLGNSSATMAHCCLRR